MASPQLLTPEEVASVLKISVRAVYKHKKSLCGIYPAGIKVLRFREDVINDIIQGQESRNGTAQKRNVRRKDPNRHGL